MCYTLFSAIGCEDPPAPKNGWVRRQGHKAEMGCDADKEQIWHLHCQDDIWKGAKINCAPCESLIFVLKNLFINYMFLSLFIYYGN